MRRPLSLLTVVVLVPLLASCDPGEPRDPAPADPPVSNAGPPDHVLTISLDSAGNPQVEPDCLEVDRRGSPIVAWESDPPETAWIVAFGATTPFRNGKQVFNGGTPGQGDDQGPIDPSAALDSYKYWVFWPDADGEFLALDPKLVIIDDAGASADRMEGGDRVQAQQAQQPGC